MNLIGKYQVLLLLVAMVTKGMARWVNLIFKCTVQEPHAKKMHIYSFFFALALMYTGEYILI